MVTWQQVLRDLWERVRDAYRQGRDRDRHPW